MKKLLMSLVCVTMVLGVTGCSKSISKITTNDLQMNVDESKEISITVEPEGMDTKDVTCKISDESIAKLDGLKVIGLKEGNTTYACSSNKVESKSKITITMSEEQKKEKEEADKKVKEQAEANENNKNNYEYKGMSKETLARKFKEAGYEEFADGDVYKYTWGPNNEYSMRFDLVNKYVDFNISGGITSAYFWAEDKGGINTCKYDYANATPYNDTTCTDAEIKELQDLKSGIEKTLSKINLSIKDLNK